MAALDREREDVRSRLKQLGIELAALDVGAVREASAPRCSLASSLTSTEGFAQWAIKHLPEIIEQEREERGDTLASVQRAYQDCCKRLDNLIKLKTSPLNADGSQLTDEEYAVQRATLVEEKQKLTRLLHDTDDPEETKRVFEFAFAAREHFAKGTPDQKKQILDAVGSNLALTDKRLIFDARTHFRVLEDAVQDMPEIRGTFEPHKSSATKGQSARFRDDNLSGRGQRDDVRTFGKLCRVVQEVHQSVKDSTSAEESSLTGQLFPNILGPNESREKTGTLAA